SLARKTLGYVGSLAPLICGYGFASYRMRLVTLEWGTGMKRTYSLVAAIVAIAAVCVACGQSKPSRDLLGPSGSADQVIAEAFRDQRSGLQVAGEGVVTRVLPDDNDGGRHQRFILRLASGQTLLVAH